MGINGLSAIGIMLAFVGIAVFGTIALREWVFRQAARNLEACFSDAAHQLPYANLPSLALETLAVLRTPSRRSALTRSHWVSTQRSIAWGCAVLDTAAPDLQLTDPRLRRWFRGILADAKRHVPAKVFVSARQFAADSLDGRSARTTTHPNSWLHGGPISAGQPAVLDPGEDIVPAADFDRMRNGRWPVADAPTPTMKGAPHVPWLHPTIGDRLLQTELTAPGAVLGEAVVRSAEPEPVDHSTHDLCRCTTCAENGCTFCRTCGYSIDEVPL